MRLFQASLAGDNGSFGPFSAEEKLASEMGTLGPSHGGGRGVSSLLYATPPPGRRPPGGGGVALEGGFREGRWPEGGGGGAHGQGV